MIDPSIKRSTLDKYVDRFVDEEDLDIGYIEELLDEMYDEVHNFAYGRGLSRGVPLHMLDDDWNE